MYRYVNVLLKFNLMRIYLKCIYRFVYDLTGCKPTKNKHHGYRNSKIY